MVDSKDDFSTTIGPDAVFKGELTFEKGLCLLGKLEGEIVSQGHLVIGEGAKLTGDAKVGTIRLDGEVKGNLNANTKVQLSATARLEGDLQTARLEVAEGAVLVGRCAIGVNGKKVEAAPSKSVTPPVMPDETSKPKGDESRRRQPQHV